MKVLIKVLGVIAVIVALFMSCLGVIRNFGDASDASSPEYVQAMESAKENIEKLKDLAGENTTSELSSQMENAQDLMDKMPSSGTFSFLGYLNILMVVITILAAVLLFKTNAKLAMLTLAGSILIFLIIYFISPDMDMGKYGPASPRSIAMMVGIPVMIAAALAFIANKQGANPAVEA